MREIATASEAPSVEVETVDASVLTDEVMESSASCQKVSIRVPIHGSVRTSVDDVTN